MKIGELEQHCGNCTIMEYCAEPFNSLCVCAREELLDVEESIYKFVAEKIQSVNRRNVSNKRMCNRICSDIRRIQKRWNYTTVPIQLRNKQKGNLTMKTVKTEEEFEKCLKEGQPFQLEGTAQVHIILLDPKKPPIIQIVGDSDDIFKMLSYVMSTIGDSALAQGRSLEEIARTLHTLADVAMFATMEDMKRKEI